MSLLRGLHNARLRPAGVDFFFQAEDGIRDVAVTGVQTCALPISVKDAAEKAGMPYVNQRWLGGLLTNFQTISKRIKRLADLDAWVEDGTMELLPTRERSEERRVGKEARARSAAQRATDKEQDIAH